MAEGNRQVSHRVLLGHERLKDTIGVQIQDVVIRRGLGQVPADRLLGVGDDVHADAQVRPEGVVLHEALPTPRIVYEVANLIAHIEYLGRHP